MPVETAPHIAEICGDVVAFRCITGFKTRGIVAVMGKFADEGMVDVFAKALGDAFGSDELVQTGKYLGEPQEEIWIVVLPRTHGG